MNWPLYFRTFFILVFLLLECPVVINLHLRAFFLLSEIVGELRSLHISPLLRPHKVGFGFSFEAFIQTEVGDISFVSFTILSILPGQQLSGGESL